MNPFGKVAEFDLVFNHIADQMRKFFTHHLWAMKLLVYGGIVAIIVFVFAKLFLFLFILIPLALMFQERLVVNQPF